MSIRPKTLGYLLTPKFPLAYIPISALWRPREEDLEFEASQGYLVSLQPVELQNKILSQTGWGEGREVLESWLSS